MMSPDDGIRISGCPDRNGATKGVKRFFDRPMEARSTQLR